ncbi:hypothetical protein AXF42_Ash014680 [Apostasia shenzhenica]|uniref:Uncharacterized protein n=1 Tax=Apostasia shenzhenica TaxID=1088818 RepID=A0A2I0AKC8_9ASPA|nr:hypothetical protein AXF42_Ash014680 [Apostasia shenzhenica]
MERLISSLSPASGASTPKPRLLASNTSTAAAAWRSELLFLPHSSFKPAVAQFSRFCGSRRLPPLPFRSLSCIQNCAAPVSEGVANSQPDAGRDLGGAFLRQGFANLDKEGHALDPMPKSAATRVASAALSVVVSAAAVTLLQTIFTLPVYATVQSATETGGRLIKTEFLSSAWTGFFAGCLHTLSGPDHLAALAPLSIGRTRIESAVVGALWGCGHDAGQLIFGLLFLLLKDRLHIEVIRTWGTRVVGITLLIIGGVGIREALEIPAPCVALENGGSLETVSGGKKKVGFATFATGIVHGLQPDALMMILPALALPSRIAGAAFLGMFLVGTVFAMGSYTVFIGSCSQALKERVPRITEKLTWAASLVAIFMGVAILISQLFGFSLY